jgi:hypothetical protein
MNKTKRNFQKNRTTRKNKTISQSGGMNLNMILYTLMMLGLIFPISAKIFGINDEESNSILEKINNKLHLQKFGNILSEMKNKKSFHSTEIQTLKTFNSPITTVFTQLMSKKSNDKNLEKIEKMLLVEDIIYFRQEDLVRMFKIEKLEFGTNKPLMKGVDFDFGESVGSTIYWGIHADALEILLKHLKDPIVNKDMLKFLLANIEDDRKL